MMKSSWKSALASLILALLALVCVGCAGAAEDGRIRVGITVYPDVKRNGITEQDAQVITNALTDGLAGTGNIKLYERRQLDAALEELRIGGSAVRRAAAA